MRRREFLKTTGAAGAGIVVTRFNERHATPAPAVDAAAAQGIDRLPRSVYQQRLSRTLDLMAEHGLAALFCEPSTNFEYLVGADFGRSERLIALTIPDRGKPVIVAPAFEVERVSRAIRVDYEVRGWAEDEDPYRVVADAVWASGPGRIGIEPSARYGVSRRLQKALADWELVDGEPLFTRLRIIKSDDELALIRRAISITETSIAATFAALEPGLSERDVGGLLSREMAARGARGGGLVQFGPGSALPHGGPGERPLALGMPVLIDAGCNAHGYRSDITRMHFFGDDPSPEYTEVFNVVLAAQTAAFEAGRPGLECQQLDRIARSLIAESGFGQYFTHRLGHGLGMDGHEPPYLVEGNRRVLEPGMVFTIEPGIYLPERWGVRIEDDFVVRERGLEPLSSRVSRI